MARTRAILVWTALACALAVPVAAAAASPLLAWREPIYIVAGLAGVLAFALLLMQPLLIGGYLPGLVGMSARQVHRWIGSLLVAAVVIHVIGLWLTSPPDVVDALLFVSPTPFSAWGVIAMWAVFAAALLAAMRRRLRLRPRTWRIGHTSLAVIVVAGSVVHALLIEGTMEVMSKVALSGLIVIATIKVMSDLRVWAKRARPR
jgi:predicted ferric reductase